MDSQFLSSAIANFSVRLCNELVKDRNVVSSPLSVQFLLGLLALGTTDPAHPELLTSLGFADDNSLRSSFSTVSSKLRSLEGVTINIANKVYIQDGSYELQPQFEEDAVKVFDAATEKVNFSDNEATVNKINTWVENKTNHKIKDILSKDSINSNSRLVLVNALYFQGTWEYPFFATHTKDQEFYINANTTIQVPMMDQKQKFRFGSSEQLQAELLELPYLGKEASMLIVLPRAVEGLNGILEKLANGHNLMLDIDNMSVSTVKVNIPKFTIESEINLKKILPKLGIHAIFDPRNSGLAKIINSDDVLYVSEAIQKAFIEVNEEGVEAAASFSSMILKRKYTRRCDFIANRPFLYMLLGADRMLLFIGTYRGVA